MLKGLNGKNRTEKGDGSPTSMGHRMIEKMFLSFCLTGLIGLLAIGVTKDTVKDWIQNALALLVVICFFGCAIMGYCLIWK